MVSRNRISLAFLLVSVGVLLMVAPARAKECDCDNANENQEGGISGFFHKVGCGIKVGVKQATDAVKDGYDIVKKKINSDDKPDPVDNPTYEVDLRSGITEEPIKLAPLP